LTDIACKQLVNYTSQDAGVGSFSSVGVNPGGGNDHPSTDYKLNQAEPDTLSMF